MSASFWGTLADVIWVALLGGLAVAGAIALAVYGVQLSRKAQALRREIDVVTGHGEQIAQLAGQFDLSSLKRD